MLLPDLCKTECEWRFAAYLQTRGLTFIYEPEVDGKHPDFQVHHDDGDVFYEVHEYDWNDEDTGGAIDPNAALRRTIKDKSEQGRGVKGRAPYVLVLCQGGLPVPLDEQSLSTAMYGNLTLAVPIEQSDEPSQEDANVRLVFGEKGKMAHKKEFDARHVIQNTRFSAIAVVRDFNPTGRRYEDALDAMDRGSSIEDDIARGLRVGEELRREGVYEPHALTQRVVAVHNHFADQPLSLDALSGPFDEQWALTDQDGRLVLTRVFVGDLLHEVPGQPG